MTRENTAEQQEEIDTIVDQIIYDSWENGIKRMFCWHRYKVTHPVHLSEEAPEVKDIMTSVILKTCEKCGKKN